MVPHDTIPAGAGRSDAVTDHTSGSFIVGSHGPSIWSVFWNDEEPPAGTGPNSTSVTGAPSSQPCVSAMLTRYVRATVLGFATLKLSGYSPGGPVKSAGQLTVCATQ